MHSVQSAECLVTPITKAGIVVRHVVLKLTVVAVAHVPATLGSIAFVHALTSVLGTTVSANYLFHTLPTDMMEVTSWLWRLPPMDVFMSIFTEDICVTCIAHESLTKSAAIFRLNILGAEGTHIRHGCCGISHMDTAP